MPCVYRPTRVMCISEGRTTAKRRRVPAWRRFRLNPGIHYSGCRPETSQSVDVSEYVAQVRTARHRRLPARRSYLVRTGAASRRLLGLIVRRSTALPLKLSVYRCILPSLLVSSHLSSSVTTPLPRRPPTINQ